MSKKEKTKPEITRDTKISELLENFPQVAEVFADYNLHCVGCIASVFDTVAQGALSHGMTDEEIDALVEDLNLVVNEESGND